MKQTQAKPILLLAFMLLDASSVFSAEVPLARPSPGPGDTIQEVNAQIAITRRGVDELHSKLGRNAVPESYALKDYWKMNPEFRKSVENALVRFEETLKKDILEGAVAPVMAEYNSLHASSAFSADQKVLLLKQQRARIDQTLASAEKTYNQAVSQAIQDAGIFVYFIETKEKTRAKNYDGDVRRTWKDLFRCEDYDCSKKKNIGSHFEKYRGFSLRKESGEKIDAEALKDVVSRLRPGCASRLCVILKAADQRTTIQLMRQLFERSIDMRLSDGVSIPIRSRTLDRLDFTSELLGMTEKFSLEDLPLDAK